MIHTSILDNDRLELLPKLHIAADHGFYLAGGTALALQLGHRDSEDFDFFCKESFNTQQLFGIINSALNTNQLLITKEDQNTLYIEVDLKIKLSFFKYDYILVEDLVFDLKYFPLASILDIACMKLGAILNRAMLRDYIDLYFILQQISLEKILSASKLKYPHIDSNVFLKGLTYMEDISMQPIMFKEGYSVDIQTVEKFIKQTVKHYYLQK